MRRSILLFLFVVGLFLGARPALATIAVGTCRPSLPSFPTISLAVAAAPAFSTVLVCPGTYPEQVIITIPLTLQGISSGNSDQAVVAVPGTGSSANVTSIFGESVAAQILVMASPVNITNITVDGTGNNLAGTGVWLAGIFYASGSSGTVNNVTTRNQIDSGEGLGIWVENGPSASVDGVTIENSSVHDVDDEGIFTGSNQTPPTLTASVKGNTVAASAAGFGVQLGSGGSVINNVVTVGFVGIFLTSSSSTTASGNTITNPGDSSFAGIWAFGADTITSNKVSSAFDDIILGANGANVQNNILAKAAVGVEFNCTIVTVVAHNTINDTLTGLDGVPLAFSGINTFSNTNTIKNNNCGFAKGSAPAAMPKMPKNPTNPFAE